MSLSDAKMRYFADSLAWVNERIMSIQTHDILDRHPFPNSSAKESVFNAFIKLADVVYKEELYIHNFSDFTKYDRKTGLFCQMLRALVTPNVDLMNSAINEIAAPTLPKAKPSLHSDPPSPSVQLNTVQISAKIDLNRDGPNALLYASDMYRLHRLRFRSRKVQQPIDLVDELFPDNSGSYPRQSQHGSGANCSKGKHRTADTGNSSKTSLSSKRKANSQGTDEDSDSGEAGGGGRHPAKRQSFQLDQNDHKLPCLHYEKASAEVKRNHPCKNREFKTIAEQIHHQEHVHKEFHCLYGAYHKVYPHRSYVEDNDCGKIYPDIACLKRHTQRVHIRAVCCENCCENFAQECIARHRRTHDETRLRHCTRYGPVVDFSTAVNKARTAMDMWQIMFGEPEDGPKYDVLSKTDHLEGNASDGYRSDILDDIAMLGERISKISHPIEMLAVSDALVQQAASIIQRMCAPNLPSSPSDSGISTNSSNTTDLR